MTFATPFTRTLAFILPFLPGLLTANSTLYAEDFEAAAGLSASGSNASWEWGSPTSGPGTAQSGTKCWATALAGNYANSEDGHITSPAIDLSAHPGNGPLIFTWWQFLESEISFDTASLEVSADGGTTWERVYGEVSGAVSPSWTRQFVLLDASAATSAFRYRFRLRSDQTDTAAGFYVDTVRISSLATTEVSFDDFEAGEAGYAPSGAVSSWEYGTPVTGPGAAWSGDKAWGTSLTGLYSASEDSSLVSPPIDLSAHAGKAFVLSWRQHLVTEATFDRAGLEVRPDPAAPWSPAYGPVSGTVSDTWMRKAVLLGPEMATPGFQLRFTLQTDDSFQSSGFFVDDVQLQAIEGVATPPITWTSPAPIMHGTPLGATQLNASSPVPGSFSYAPGPGSVLPLGDGQLLEATFTPDDLLTYAPVVTSVTIDVVPATGSYETWMPFPDGTPSSETIREADFDHDGLTNLHEYGFVTDATSPDNLGAPRVIAVDVGGTDHLGLEFSIRSDDPSLLYGVESSPDCAGWMASPLTFDGASWTLATGDLVIVSSQELSPGIWRLQIREILPASARPQHFMRLSLTE